MLFDVSHRTVYRYAAPVTLDPHVLRVRPRLDGTQRLLRYSIRVAPQPVGITETMDPMGNPLTCVWFEGQTEYLDIQTSLAVEVTNENPFEYRLREPGVGTLPAVYGDQNRRLLAPYLGDGTACDPSVAALAEEVAAHSDGNTQRFVVDLGREIKRRIGYAIREEGEPFAAAYTLSSGVGSCRDLAVLYIAACRHMGLAARFVSGYVQGGPDIREKRYLHAWAEVYLPGGGWRGFDPTHALAVADHHLAIAAGPEPVDAAPILGTYRGDGITSRLESHINVQVYPLLSASASRSA